MNHEIKHDPNNPAGTPQSQETGGNQQRVSADCAACEADPNVGFHFPDGDTLHFSAGGSRSALRAESYARACRSRAAILCASTDAEDALALAIYACQPAEAFANGQAIYRRRYRRTEDPS